MLYRIYFKDGTSVLTDEYDVLAREIRRKGGIDNVSNLFAGAIYVEPADGVNVQQKLMFTCNTQFGYAPKGWRGALRLLGAWTKKVEAEKAFHDTLRSVSRIEGHNQAIDEVREDIKVTGGQMLT